MPDTLFVTGRLAADALRKTLDRLELDFDYDVAVLGGSVAALMRTEWIARRLPEACGCRQVMIPGLCRGDLAAIEARVGVPVVRGPKDLKDLPAFFGQARDLEGYGEYTGADTRRDRRGLPDVLCRHPQPGRVLPRQRRRRHRPRLPADGGVPGRRRGGRGAQGARVHGQHRHVSPADHPRSRRGGGRSPAQRERAEHGPRAAPALQGRRDPRLRGGPRVAGAQHPQGRRVLARRTSSTPSSTRSASASPPRSSGTAKCAGGTPRRRCSWASATSRSSQTPTASASTR